MSMTTKKPNKAAMLRSANLSEYVAAGGDEYGDNHRILEKLVEREVVRCCSSLISHFAQNEEALTGSDYSYDEVLDLCRNRKDNSAEIETVADEISDLEDEIDSLEDDKADVESNRKNASIDAEIADKRKQLTALEERKQELEDEQEEESEVYEHWIVSKWFANRLAEHGETTGELFDFTIWGRCTTGQSISMDGVIAEIAASMQILKGQRNAWTD